MDETTYKSELEMNEINTARVLKNSAFLEREFQWFEMVLNEKFQNYFQGDDRGKTNEVTPPDSSDDDSNYAQLIRQYDFGIPERLVLCLALAPHLKSNVLDLFFTNNPQLNRPFTEFGGYTGKDHIGFLPTGETAAFLLSDGQIEGRVNIWEIFSARHPFATENIVSLERREPKEPFLSGRLLINDSFLYSLTTGENYLPESTDLFPAKEIHTEMNWEDLVVSSHVMEGILEIKTWINNEKQLMQDQVFRKHVKPGFRTLFYGPPGTGKTMTASLLGKSTGLPVYRIDLSLIVSKYIGETEKNLEKIFHHAERQNWILFFDEADALFGKRTQTSSSNDRYANQEVAYLLQRIESFPGIIILASNLKSNMDAAFSRRFQSTVYFPLPDVSQRKLLWENIFSGQIKPEPSIDLNELAEKYELSGGAMINVLRSSTLKAVEHRHTEIKNAFIIESIRKEFQKYGKTL